MQRMRKSMLVESRSSLIVFFTTVLLLSLGSASAGGKDPLSPSPVRPGNLDYRIELPQGYLKVYTATDEFDDGGVPYYAHSSYTIYTTDGKVAGQRTIVDLDVAEQKTYRYLQTSHRMASSSHS